jgi:hypothetical protein
MDESQVSQNEVLSLAGCDTIEASYRRGAPAPNATRGSLADLGVRPTGEREIVAAVDDAFSAAC